jgi:hypothetical protein
MTMNFFVDAVMYSLASSNPAYLDPGSGSYLLQLILAGLLGAGFAVRMFWGRIKEFFRRGSSEEETQDEGD